MSYKIHVIIFLLKLFFPLKEMGLDGDMREEREDNEGNFYII